MGNEHKQISSSLSLGSRKLIHYPIIGALMIAGVNIRVVASAVKIRVIGLESKG